MGKILKSSTSNSTDNILSVYIISNKDFKDSIYIKVLNSEKIETGRTGLKLELVKGHANYYDFKFDSRTDIDFTSIIEMW